MKLIELLKEDKVLTCWDTDYDTEFYMEPMDESEDTYNKAMMEFARNVEVDKITPYGIEVKATELITHNLERKEFRDLFIDPDIDAVMEDFEAIMAGYAGMKWYGKFAELLKGE